MEHAKRWRSQRVFSKESAATHVGHLPNRKGVRPVGGCNRWAYRESGWARIAALAPAVLECAEDGDLVAFKIVTTAADEAVRAAETVAAKAKLKGRRFKMILSGESFQRCCMPRAGLRPTHFA